MATKRTILIIDNDHIVTSAYRMAFEKAGYKATVANNPVDGLELAKTEQPSVVLLEMLMMQMNGIEFLKQLKKKRITKPIVFGFSNIENEDVIDAARKMGVIDYLLKVDHSPDTIQETITKYLNSEAH